MNRYYCGSGVNPTGSLTALAVALASLVGTGCR
jgi:hypothetical protein